MGINKNRTRTLLFLFLFCLSACASVEQEELPVSKTEGPLVDEESRKQINELNTKIQNLETKLSALTDKINATQMSIAAGRGPASAPPTGISTKEVNVLTHAADQAGQLTLKNTSKNDPDAGFINDEAVQIFRRSMLLFDAQKYPEAVLSFSDFLEKFPDHPLAGSSQFYIGQAYARQKECKLAVQEFQRVLASYDRSPHISDTLNEIALAQDCLKKTSDGARYRQLLTSLFPQSPAAWVPPPAPEMEGAPATEDPSRSIATNLPENTTPSEGKSNSNLDQPPGNLPEIPTITPPTAPIEEKAKTPEQNGTPPRI